MPEPADQRDLATRRRLYVLLRALMPTENRAEPAWQETLTRIEESPRASDDSVARDVAALHRKSLSQLPFSDDLFRQLADSAPTNIELVERRPQILSEILNRLPQPEKELLRRKYEFGMTAEQIASIDGRPPATVQRDLTILHGTLVSSLQEALPDGGPPAPGGAGDLGRLVDQLLDGTISDDGRLVLETLLLADAAAQAHYHRHVALRVELECKYLGEPTQAPRRMPIRRPMTFREWLVTIAFLVVCLAVIAFIALLFTGQLKKWS